MNRPALFNELNSNSSELRILHGIHRFDFLAPLMQELALLAPGKPFAQQAHASVAVNIVVSVRLQAASKPVATSQLCVEGKPSLNPWGLMHTLTARHPGTQGRAHHRRYRKTPLQAHPPAHPPLAVMVSFRTGQGVTGGKLKHTTITFMHMQLQATGTM